MATEEEAREAADGKEVQVEALDLEHVHMQTHLDSKLSSMEIKNMGEIIDSTEGKLTIPEDQFLVEAPSEVRLPPEHKQNGTASSLNGHTDGEEKISNVQLHEDNKKDQEEVEDALDGQSTDQSNTTNKQEVTTCLSHEGSSAEDNSLLKVENEEESKEDGQQDLEGVTTDNDMVQEDTVKTNNAVGQIVVGQQDQNLDPAKATEDTQPACMANIPDVEIVAEAPPGVQTPVEPNLGDSDVIPENIDGNTAIDEPAKADSSVHHDHKESFPEDTSIAEHTDEVAKVEDQQSKHADIMDADVVQEEMPKSGETDVQEDMPKSEHTDESTKDGQEVLNRESTEETNGPVNENTEETVHQSNTAASDETMSEHDATMRESDVNIQVQNRETLEEIEDAETADTEAAMQQSNIAFEEAIQEDHVATTEPSSDTQHAHNVEPEEINGPGDAKDEDITNTSNVALAEYAVQDNIIQSDPTENIQPVEELEQTDKASEQTHATACNDLAQEDGGTASEPKMVEIAAEVTEATETQEITQQGHVASSKELSTEDDSTASEMHDDDIQQTLEQDPVETKNTETAKTHNEKVISTSENNTVEGDVTAEGPTCGSQEVDGAESTEAITENIAENTLEISDVATVDQADEGNNMLRAEDIAVKHIQGIEPEETKNTGPAETEEASDQRNAALLNDSAQEDFTSASMKQQMESAIEIKEIEATYTEATPRESNACVSEEPSSKDYITESETTRDNEEVNTTESSDAVETDKDIKTGEISDQSNMDFAGESTHENNVPESEPTPDIQSVQEAESEEIKNAELVEVNKTSNEMNAAVFQKPTQEDNPTMSELHIMESAGEVSNIEATEVQATPRQSNADQSEEQTEHNVITSEPQILERESIEEMKDTEATEPQSNSQQSIISTSEESDAEKIATEDNVTVRPDVGHQQLLNQESVEFNEIEANKPQGIASSSIVSTSEESTSEDNVVTPEPSSDTHEDSLQSAEVLEDTENVKRDTALAEEAAPDEHLEAEATVGISLVQEPELGEAKNTEPVETEDNMTSNDLPAEEMDKETMETIAIPHDSPVESVKELTEDDILAASAPHADIQSVGDIKCTDTTEHPEEPQQIIGSISDELTPTEEKTTVTDPACDTQHVQNVKAQEIKESEDTKIDQISNINSFPTPEEAGQESNIPRMEPTSDVRIDPSPYVKQEQELGSVEETRGIEAIEDHQQQRTSNLEEPAVDSEPVDDQQVHEDKPAEVKDNEATETEEVFKQSNIATSDTAAEGRKELGSDLDFYVQPAQQVEPSSDSEGSQLLNAEEPSGQSNVDTFEERTTEDSAPDEIDPPVVTKQEHELESAEEIKAFNATEAEEDSHTSQPDALEKLASEDNETAPEGHPVESHEENLGYEIDNAMLGHGIKDEIQTSAELKDDACDSGETVFTTQKSKNTTNDDAVQSSGDDTLETSNKIDQIKEEQMAGTEHTSSQMSSEQLEENKTEVQDKDIKGELVTEIGTVEASLALLENDPQESQGVTEKEDTIESGEQTSDQDNMQPGDVALQPQVCESSVEDEALQKVNLDEQQKDEEIESQKEEVQADEQKQEDKRDDDTTETLVELQNVENGTTNRTEDTDASETKQTEAGVTEVFKNEQALHISVESTPSITDIKIENIMGTYEGPKEENRPNNASILDADAKNDNQENEEKDNIVSKDSNEEDETISPQEKEDETTGEITNEELESGLASSVQEISDPAPSNDRVPENDPIATPLNVESGVHREDKECANKVNDDVPANHESEKEIVAEVEENKEMQNEDNDVHHDESHIKPEDEETSQLNNNEPYDVDSKMDDETTHCAAIFDDNTTIKPREIEEMGGKSGNVEQDLSIHDKVEDKKLATTEHNAVEVEPMQENADSSSADTEREMSLSEKALPTEPEVQEENQLPKENDEEDMHEPEIGDAQKEVHQDLPVSHFLMNLILGKENSDANGNSEPEAGKKQQETGDDNSCLIISKQEESLVSLPTENKVDDKITFQQKNDVKSSEETQEMDKEPSHDLKLDTERSLETDVELNKNTDELELPAYQDNGQDKTSSELLSEETAGLATKLEAKDIEISNVDLDNRVVDTTCQENMEATTQIENGRLKNNIDDLKNTKASEKDTPGEGQTGLLCESLPEDISADAESEQTLLLTESGMADAKSLPSEADSVQNPITVKHDKIIEFSNTGDRSIPEFQLEGEKIDKTEEKHHATTATGEVLEEHVETSHDNLQKSTFSGATSDEQAPQITEPISDTEIALAHEKETSKGSGSTCMDEKESSNFSTRGVENFQTSVEIQSDSSNMQINQETQDEAADNQTEMEPEKLGESNFQEHQENGTEKKSPKGNDEVDQQFSVKKEAAVKEEDAHETVESHTKTVMIKSNEEHKLFDSKVQERDFNVASPKESPGAEENFVDVTKSEFSTDEEQSPKADKANMEEEKAYDEKTKDKEETKNFSDEVKTEEPGAGQKAHKKHNLLSGVGSKVKHQLAKVKKAIVGKPGHTKPESPK